MRPRCFPLRGLDQGQIRTFVCIVDPKITAAARKITDKKSDGRLHDRRSIYRSPEHPPLGAYGAASDGVAISLHGYADRLVAG